MTIHYTQPSCPFLKVINRSLAGTNNYKTHYKNEHPNIPYIREQKKAITDKEAGLKERKPFLPPRRRLTKQAPSLKSITSFIFIGVYPLYSREII